MITLIFGSNHYGASQALKDIIQDFSQPESIERYDGEPLEINDLRNMLQNISLFASHRLIIVRDAHQNKGLWDELHTLLDDLPAEIHLVLFESTPDKRTKTFKYLQKTATVLEYSQFTEAEAIRWLSSQAKDRRIPLDQSMVELLVRRLGTDQWQLTFTLEKLQHVDTVSPDSIISSTVALPQANSFDLIDAVLAGDTQKTRLLIQQSSVTEDPYFFFGLLSSQLYQLITLKISNLTADKVARELKVHPYPLQKMKSSVMKLTGEQIKVINDALSVCDDQLKRSSASPWEVVEQALMKIAMR